MMNVICGTQSKVLELQPLLRRKAMVPRQVVVVIAERHQLTVAVETSWWLTMTT